MLLGYWLRLSEVSRKLRSNCCRWFITNCALRATVEALLRATNGETCFLDQPAATLVEMPSGECPGTVIGPYKLLVQIGEGGFGVVFMAEQHRPVRRRVALKVVKPGMDTNRSFNVVYNATNVTLVVVQNLLAASLPAGSSADL